MYPVRAFFSQGRQQGNVSDEKGDETLEAELAEWVEAQLKTGAWTEQSLGEAITDDMVGKRRILPEHLRKHMRRSAIAKLSIFSDGPTSTLRHEVEKDTFEVIASRSKSRQIEAFAAILRDAAEIDKRTALLRGAITQMEKTSPREGIWRVLQGLADSYREGEPLCMKDRAVLLANNHLSRDVMAKSLFKNDSKAANTRKAATEKVSKTIAKAKRERTLPLPDSVQVDARDRFPLLSTLARVAAECLGVHGFEIIGSGGTVLEETGPSRPDVADSQLPPDETKQAAATATSRERTSIDG